MSHYTDEGWVNEMLGLDPPTPPCPDDYPEVRPNTLWVSRVSGRRGTVIWIIQEQVCLEWREGVSSLYELADFLRLYTEVV